MIRKIRKKTSDEKGFSLIITLLVLITLTLIAMGSFHHVSLDILIAQNSADQPEALQNAYTCEALKIQEAKDHNSDDTGLNLNNPKIHCQTNFHEPLPTVPIPGWSYQAAIRRYRTVGQGKRGSMVTIYTDIPFVSFTGSGAEGGYP